MKRFHILTLFLLIFMSGLKSQNDKFADIGTQVYDLKSKNLVQPQPLMLSDISLPTVNNLNVRFKVVNPISTKEELAVLIDTLREKYKPFMRNLAPVCKSNRKQIILDEFKWRVANGEDSCNFQNVLIGKGKWENVSIPHFGPPIGRATTLYYKELNLNQDIVSQEAVFICFKGVDYKAHVFVNGNYCGSHEGFFAPFEFNISKAIKLGTNTLVIKVENDLPTTPWGDGKGNTMNGDKIYAATGPGYDEPNVGWHHGSPGMGIYQDCYIETRSKLHINDIFVRPLPEKSTAEAWIEVNNFEDIPVNAKLRVSVFGQNFNDTVISDFEYTPSTVMVPGIGDLAKPSDNEKRILKMGYGVNFLRIPIDMKNFRYWDNENPWLYQVQVKVYDKNNKLTDSKVRQFGMRSFTMDTVNTPKGKMYLNGKMIRLRGANTMGFEQQDVIRKNWDQLRDDILLAKACNMNFLRITQRPVQPEVYDMCDKLGMMNQVDLPLFGSIRRNKVVEAVKQAEEMERLVRSHPSTIIATYINERFPNAEGYTQRSLSTSAEYYRLFSALDQAVLLSNPDRVIKAGDGDYNPPSPGLPDSHCYNTWYNGHGLGLGEMYKGYWQPIKPNWYYGCGEFGAEGLDPLNVMQKYYPKSWLPKNKEDEKIWNANRIPSAQTHRFHYMWYNTQTSLKDWIDASQDYQAWAVKFVSETFRRDSRMVSFAIHLFIDAWPAGWMKTIMDVDRQPKKAFFAYRNALEPVITSIRCDRQHFYVGEEAPFELWISNDLNQSPDNYFLHYQIEHAGKVIFSNKVKADIPVNSSRFQGFFKFKAPNVKQRTAYILRTALIDKNGKSIQQNSFDFEVFPKISKCNKTAFVSGEIQGKVTQLLQEADIRIVNNMNDADVLLFENYDSYIQIQEEVNEQVSKGKIALFVELPAKQYSIGKSILKIEKTAMGDYYFVSPLTNHPMVQKYKPFDFRFWVNEKSNCISPILAYTMTGDKWTPIIKSGASNWVGDKGSVMACAELKYGEGVFRICEVQLLDRLNYNPTARLFFNDLLSK